MEVSESRTPQSSLNNFKSSQGAQKVPRFQSYVPELQNIHRKMSCLLRKSQIFLCDKFKNLSIQERKNIVFTAAKLCFNCLNSRAKAFKKMIEKVQLQKVWSDKGTEFKGAFKILCDQRGIATYTTASEPKSAFAERNIRSLKNIMYKHMENKWTYHYISKLSQFVRTINSRVNRVTKLAPNKVTKKHEPHLRSLAAEQSSKFVKKPKKLSLRDKVRKAKQDLPFKKGYKQSFTDEIFTIIKISTFNPPTYNLRDESGDTINGKFYEPELVKVNGRI